MILNKFIQSLLKNVENKNKHMKQNIIKKLGKSLEAAQENLERKETKDKMDAAIISLSKSLVTHLDQIHKDNNIAIKSDGSPIESRIVK